MNEKEYYSLKGYISSSSLKYLEEDPMKFKKFINGELEQEDTNYLGFGKMVHLYLLERNVFTEQVEVFDYTIPKSPQQKKFIEDYQESNDLLKAYRNNYATKEKDETVLSKAQKLVDTLDSYVKYLEKSKTKQVISTKDYERIASIGKSVAAHKKANEFINTPHSNIDDIDYREELQLMWNFRGIKCKSMLDKVIVDNDNKVIKIVDVKTTSSLSKFKESFDKYRYDRQLAFYGMAIDRSLSQVIDEYYDEEEYTIEYYVVAIDTINHNVKVFNIKSETIIAATKEIEDLLIRAGWHIVNSKWSHSKEYYEGDGTEEL